MILTKDWIVACSADEVNEGGAHSVTVAGRRICIVRHEDRLYALSDLCSHGQAYLSEGYCDTTDCVLECPLHGGLVDFRTGKAMSAPIEKDAPVFATKVEDGMVLIEIEAA